MLKPLYLTKLRGDKFFRNDHIIEKFFKKYHDDESFDELIRWQIISKSEFFNASTLQTFYQKFLRRRKQILDAHFEWTPENMETFVLLNRKIYKAERDIYNNLKVIRKTFMDLQKKGHYFLDVWSAYSHIDYMGSYIEHEDENDFPGLLYDAMPDIDKTKFVRNAFFSFRSGSQNKLEKPSNDWAYEFNKSQRVCASIDAFKKLPLHKHAGFLMFDSGIYALQDFVNMDIRFEATTEIRYYD